MITPLIVAACSAAGNIALALLLIGPLGYPGLALSNSISISIEVLVLLYLLRRRLGHVEERQSLSALGRILIAAAAMAAVILLVQGAVDGRGALVAAVAAGGAGVLVYAIVAYALGLRLPITRAQNP